MDEAKLIKDAIHYIRTHEPQETDFDTIDVAIRAVAPGICAAASEDIVSKDDAWLVPEEKRGVFAGLRGRGWAQTLDKETINLFYETVKYVRIHGYEFKKNVVDSTDYNDINNLKQMRDELINNINNKVNYDEFVSNFKQK